MAKKRIKKEEEKSLVHYPEFWFSFIFTIGLMICVLLFG